MPVTGTVDGPRGLVWATSSHPFDQYSDCCKTWGTATRSRASFNDLTSLSNHSCLASLAEGTPASYRSPCPLPFGLDSHGSYSPLTKLEHPCMRPSSPCSSAMFGKGGTGGLWISSLLTGGGPSGTRVPLGVNRF